VVEGDHFRASTFPPSKCFDCKSVIWFARSPNSLTLHFAMSDISHSQMLDSQAEKKVAQSKGRSSGSRLSVTHLSSTAQAVRPAAESSMKAEADCDDDSTNTFNTTKETISTSVASSGARKSRKSDRTHDWVQEQSKLRGKAPTPSAMPPKASSVVTLTSAAGSESSIQSPTPRPRSSKSDQVANKPSPNPGPVLATKSMLSQPATANAQVAVPAPVGPIATVPPPRVTISLPEPAQAGPSGLQQKVTSPEPVPRSQKAGTTLNVPAVASPFHRHRRLEVPMLHICHQKALQGG